VGSSFLKGHGAIVFHKRREVVVAAAACELILPLSIVDCALWIRHGSRT
jgi:hypothetical protein